MRLQAPTPAACRGIDSQLRLSPGRPAKVPVVRLSSGRCRGVLPSWRTYFRLRRARSPSLSELASKSSQLAAAHSLYVGTSMRDIFPKGVLCIHSPRQLKVTRWRTLTFNSYRERNTLLNSSFKTNGNLNSASSSLPLRVSLDKMAMLYAAALHRG